MRDSLRMAVETVRMRYPQATYLIGFEKRRSRRHTSIGHQHIDGVLQQRHIGKRLLYTIDVLGEVFEQNVGDESDVDYQLK